MCAEVVVAEDDPDQAELVRRYLEHEGHAVTVVHDGRSALDLLRGRCPDLLVLDVMMPRVDGLDVCRIVRADPRLADLAVIMLTARSAEDDLLLGLDLGADDYLAKPFSPRELMARIRSLLRRSERIDREGDERIGEGAGFGPGRAKVSAREADVLVLRVGQVTVDPARHEIWAYGRPIRCTPGEFRLLEMLAEYPGRVLSRAQILERLHGSDPFITPRTVDVHVMNLRRKLKDARPDAQSPSPLVTVYGVGYKLTDERVRPHG
ncbi:response regulator transcription factor [[Kitasatospora] papulosa]|uniref:response regulator transcription factor n=1 Tax=[Kitasatospora] papulosa TaxID=1464011 RepID=UPI00368332A0